MLAAGEGRRFGGDKLQALYRGRPLLSHVLDVVAAARENGLLDDAFVVIAADDKPALRLVRDAGLLPTVNGSPHLGLSHSLHLGLQALEPRSGHEPSAVLVFLGDQPLVRLDVLERLVGSWRGGMGSALRPRYQQSPDTPGHPVLLSRAVWPLARQLTGDRGFGSLLHSPSSDWVTIDVPGNNPDVDTPADLRALEESSG